MFGNHFHTAGFLPTGASAENAPVAPAQGTTISTPLLLRAGDLPALCPNAGMELWASHPRVYLEVVNEAEAMCPYCGTHYRLHSEDTARDHHAGGRALHQHRAHGMDRGSGAARSVLREGGETRFALPCPDELGNTTLELMTRWLRGERN